MYFVSDSESKTKEFARRYAQSLSKGDNVLLCGEMGAGKTLFAKGVAEGLNIKAEVLSPTYTYMNDYGGLYHFDFYRLSSGVEAEERGLCDYFYAGGICLIEWGENVKEVLPKNCKKVTITVLGETARGISYE